jgi:transcriptional regulator with XRE-family HTH domain
MKLTSSQQVAALFRDLRKHAGLTQQQMADRLGISQSTVYDRERRTAARHGQLPLEALISAADLFGLDVVLIRRDTGKPA